MRILHISSAKSWRGGERQVHYLIEGLQESGHENFLMTPKQSALGKKGNLQPQHILEFKKGIFSLVSNIKTLKSICNREKIDIIHGHDSYAHSLIWMAYKTGRLHTRSMVTRRLINPVKRRSRKKYNDAKIEKIICISEAVKKALSPSIEDPSRLTVIHSAIDTSTKTDKSEKKRAPESFKVGYVAAFTEEKDHDTFIAVAKQLCAQYPKASIDFVLVGNGPLLKKTKEACKNIESNIEFTGFVEDVDSVYKRIDLLLHTSKSEALGTSILDALKFGIPVVATNIGGIPEIIQNGKNGFLFDVGDYKNMAEQIYQIVSNPTLYASLSSNSLANISKFDIARMVEKTLALYKSIHK